MTKLNYNKRLKAKYVDLAKKGISLAATKGLSKVLALPHPKRERAFVEWCQRSIGSESGTTLFDFVDHSIMI